MKCTSHGIPVRAPVLYSRIVSRLVVVVALAALALSTGCMVANPKEQRAKNEVKLQAEGIEALTPGDAAPTFVAQCHPSGTVEVPDGLVEQRLVLFFYPANMTPNSTRELLQLVKAAEELSSRGIVVGGVSGGSMRDHATFAERFQITIPLLIDEDLSIARAYGCVPEGGELVQRTLVGIEADGAIAFYERGFPLGNPATKIYEWFGIAPPSGEPVAEQDPA